VGAVPTVWIAIQGILEKEPSGHLLDPLIPDRRVGRAATLIELFDKKYGAYMPTRGG